jgi:8-oxo-dGTP diphosphatase
MTQLTHESTDATLSDRSTHKRYEMPFCRIELAVMSLVDDRLQVLLGRRSEPPHPGRWALPGGVVRIDLDADLEQSARRVMRERLQGELPFMRQVCAVGGRTRDPRAPWALSVVYRTLAHHAVVPTRPGKRIQQLRWCTVEEAQADADLAFDHGSLVAQAARATREDVDALRIPPGLLPDTFTLGEMQSLCEQVLGRSLDKSSFRRRLADHDVVEPVEGELRGGRNRPAQVFKLRSGEVGT